LILTESIGKKYHRFQIPILRLPESLEKNSQMLTEREELLPRFPFSFGAEQDDQFSQIMDRG
jgi:hypothetical protein